MINTARLGNSAFLAFALYISRMMLQRRAAPYHQDGNGSRNSWRTASDFPGQQRLPRRSHLSREFHRSVQVIRQLAKAEGSPVAANRKQGRWALENELRQTPQSASRIGQHQVGCDSRLGNLEVGMGGILSDSGKQEKTRGVPPRAVHADKS